MKLISIKAMKLAGLFVEFALDELILKSIPIFLMIVFFFAVCHIEEHVHKQCKQTSSSRILYILIRGTQYSMDVSWSHIYIYTCLFFYFPDISVEGYVV